MLILERTLPGTHAKDALVTTSLDGHVLGFNRGAQALLGWREREILGRPVDDLLHEKHRALDRQSVLDVRGGACVRNTLAKLVRKDGAVLNGLQSMLPIRDAVGKVVAVLRIVVDLSFVQDAERALRRGCAQVKDLELAGPADAAHDPQIASGTGRFLAEERARTLAEALRVVESESGRLRELLEDLERAAHQRGSELAHAVQEARADRSA